MLHTAFYTVINATDPQRGDQLSHSILAGRFAHTQVVPNPDGTVAVIAQLWRQYEPPRRVVVDAALFKVADKASSLEGLGAKKSSVKSFDFDGCEWVAAGGSYGPNGSERECYRLVDPDAYDAPVPPWDDMGKNIARFGYIGRKTSCRGKPKIVTGPELNVCTPLKVPPDPPPAGAGTIIDLSAATVLPGAADSPLLVVDDQDGDWFVAAYAAEQADALWNTNYVTAAVQFGGSLWYFRNSRMIDSEGERWHIALRELLRDDQLGRWGIQAFDVPLGYLLEEQGRRVTFAGERYAIGLREVFIQCPAPLVAGRLGIRLRPIIHQPAQTPPSVAARPAELPTFGGAGVRTAKTHKGAQRLEREKANGQTELPIW